MRWAHRFARCHLSPDDDGAMDTPIATPLMKLSKAGSASLFGFRKRNLL
jgi:hypothetical protein